MWSTKQQISHAHKKSCSHQLEYMHKMEKKACSQKGETEIKSPLKMELVANIRWIKHVDIHSETQIQTDYSLNSFCHFNLNYFELFGNF